MTSTMTNGKNQDRNLEEGSWHRGIRPRTSFQHSGRKGTAEEREHRTEQEQLPIIRRTQNSSEGAERESRRIKLPASQPSSGSPPPCPPSKARC
ncbi:hypothetical protein SKAU_G00388240 [Synaphobranchus kaupii]|uniref:Uncharacterized protein n=1 Tax=Synaphobranchus kaupii TaxID=118154 RepID=A0A9Q1EB34_SYNKA|nr:hypothetical protein SKAU_G00388240 [Synaphobranchus kaupii]